MSAGGGAPYAPKSTGLAYVLWFFLGGLGVHRFYLGRIGSGVALLILNLTGWATVVFVVGFFLLGAVLIWWIALFGVGCLVYMHMSERQVEQMSAETDDFLRSAPHDRAAQGTLQLDGGSVAIRVEPVRPAADLLAGQQIESAGVSQNQSCRRTSRGVNLDSGTRLDGEHIYCLTEDGDFVPVTNTDFVIAS